MLVEFFVGLFLILAVGMGVGGVRVDYLYQVLERTLGVRVCHACSIKQMMEGMG